MRKHFERIIKETFLKQLFLYLSIVTACFFLAGCRNPTTPGETAWPTIETTPSPSAAPIIDKIGSWRRPNGPGGEMISTYISGTYLYCACDTGGLKIFDITNQASPEYVGCYDEGGQAYGVSVSGSHAYVAEGGGFESSTSAIPLYRPWLAAIA